MSYLFVMFYELGSEETCQQMINNSEDMHHQILRKGFAQHPIQNLNEEAIGKFCQKLWLKCLEGERAPDGIKELEQPLQIFGEFEVIWVGVLEQIESPEDEIEEGV